MGYASALESAGATVLEFNNFGSYQGEWWAKVCYEGKVFWVSGSFGSCSGCDAFVAEFGYNCGDRCEEHQYEYNMEIVNNCPDCQAAPQKYKERLADFGRVYLDGGYSQSEAEESAKRNLEWDSEAQEMVDFIVNNAI